jgi:acid phosphatase (class A)
MMKLKMVLIVVSMMSTHAQAEEKLFYLSPDSISVNQVLPSFPTTSSIEYNLDFSHLLKLQNERTMADCERAKDEAAGTLALWFGPKYGPLSDLEIQKRIPLFEKVKNDTVYFVKIAKEKWKRPRPYFENTAIHPCLERTDSFAYPSGDAALARVLFESLAFTLPAKRVKLKDRAEQIADDRVLAGMHHPSDIEAGKKLGDAIFSVLNQSAKFKADLKSYQ